MNNFILGELPGVGNQNCIKATLQFQMSYPEQTTEIFICRQAMRREPDPLPLIVVILGSAIAIAA